MTTTTTMMILMMMMMMTTMMMMTMTMMMTITIDNDDVNLEDLKLIIPQKVRMLVLFSKHESEEDDVTRM